MRYIRLTTKQQKNYLYVNYWNIGCLQASYDNEPERQLRLSNKPFSALPIYDRDWIRILAQRDCE